MAMSSRAKKRLLIVVAAAVLLGAGGVGLIVTRNVVRARKADNWYASGVALYEEHKLAECLDPLARFISRAPETDRRMPDALLKFAQAQKQVPSENNRHLASAAAQARRAADLMPASVEAREILLEVYLAMGLLTETMDVTTQILALEPNHEEAMWARVRALASLGRRDEALTAARDLVAAHPDNIVARRAVIELMVSNGAEVEEMLEYAQTTIDDLPNSAGAALLYARLLIETNRLAEGVEQFQRARSLPVENAATLREFVRVLDRMRAQSGGLGDAIPDEFVNGELVNEMLANAQNDPALRGKARALMVERMWKQNQVIDAAALASDLVEDASTADTEALAWAALLRMESDPASYDNSPYVAELDRRLTDEAAAWRAVLAGRAAMIHNDLAAAMEHFNEAQVAQSATAGELVAFWTAEINNAMGEYQRAVERFQAALSIDPAWERARLSLLNAHMQQKNTRAAFESLASGAAWLQRPTTTDGFYIVARVIVAAVEEGLPGASQQAAVDTAASLAEIAPESGDFAALHARALLAVGRTDDADAEITRLLSQELPANTAELQALLEAMRRAEVPGADLLMARIRDRAGTNPDVRLQVALDAARAGRADEGEQMLRAAVAAAPSNEARLASERVLLQYLDQIKAPNAVEALTAFADANPSSVLAQRTLLDSQSAWTSESTVQPAIARLRAVTGESAAAWRIYEARRMLTFHANESSAAEALSTLAPLTRREPADISALVLAAEANRLLADRDAAIDALARVMDVEPTRPGVAPQLIAMLRDAGRNDEAVRRLRDYLQTTDLTLAERRRRAQLLMEQSMWEVALPELEIIAEEGGPRDQVYYAVALARQGQTDRAAEILEALIRSGDADTEAIVAAADFFASQRDMARAEAALATLPSDLGQTQMRLIEAAFRARHGQQDRADAILEELARTAPSAQVWLERMRQAESRGDTARAAELLAEATSRWPEDPQVQAMTRVRQVSNLAGLSPQEISELASSMAVPAERAAAQQLLSAMQMMQSAGAVSDQALVALRRITAEYPTYYPGWRVLVNALVSAGGQERMNEAMQAARSAVDLIPSSPEAAQLAYELFRQAGLPDDAANAARQWRQRVVSAPYNADIAIANTELTRGRYDVAFAAIAPWRERILAEATTNPGAVELLAALLVRTGAADDAHAILWDRAVSDDNWAIIYIRVAAALDPSSSDIEAWLERISEEIDSPPARILLAQAWMSASAASGAQDRQRRAIPLLEQVAQGDQLATEALTLLGILYENLGDAAEAEQAYRRAIRRTPTFSIALNNLAYLLIKNDGDAAEAVDLSRRAIAAVGDAAPADQRSGYLDTLAAGLRASGDTAEAVNTYREAIRINPSLTASHIGLAEALLDMNDVAGATTELQVAGTLLSQRPDPDLRARLDAALARVDSMAAPAGQ